MSFILSIETSAKVCSAAVHENGILLASAEVHIEQSHASKLSVLIDQVLQTANVNIQQLNAVAVTSGPGSYTGLRIGTSTAKGLCFSLDIPFISIGTLQLMAWQMKAKVNSSAYLCPMIDARRMEVYCCMYDTSLEIIQPVEAKVIDESSFQELLHSNQLVFFGDGSDKCIEKITHPNASFVKAVYPSASNMGPLAFEKYSRHQFEDLLLFEPHYLKEFMIKKSNKITE